MKKKSEKKPRSMRKEYDFSQLKGGVRGKYASRFKAGTNLAVLSPEVAKVFPTSDAVNNALRMLLKVAKKSTCGSD